MEHILRRRRLLRETTEISPFKIAFEQLNQDKFPNTAMHAQ